LAILGQKTLDRFGNTFPVQKQKILPLFVSKGQRVNKVLEKNHWYKNIQSLIKVNFLNNNNKIRINKESNENSQSSSSSGLE
jgi:hypothetical protein